MQYIIFYFYCLLLYQCCSYIHSYIPFQSLKTLNSNFLQSNSLLHLSFHLENYIHKQFLISSNDIHKSLRTKYIPLTQAIHELKNNTRNNEDNTIKTSHIFLIDLSIRSIKDLHEQATMLDHYPFWKSFIQKLQYQKEEISQDKFIYCHDVGIDYVSKVILARVPQEMYQKLDFARHIVNTIGSVDRVVLHLIGMSDDNWIDSISDAMISAFTASRFALPSFKQSDRDSSAFNEAYQPISLDIVDCCEQQDISRDVELIKENTIQDFSESISQLEQIMLKAARDRDDRRYSTTSDEGNDYQTNKHSINEKHDLHLHKSKIISHGTNIARSLSMLPPNILHPSSYSNICQLLANNFQWEFSSWTPKELLQQNCGAFYSICTANMNMEGDSSDRLIRLVYRGSKASDTNTMSNQKGGLVNGNMQSKPIVFVGKGITYDTGGINLKSANSMKTMKHDMSGSAICLGTLVALTMLNYEHDVEVWLAIAENNIPCGKSQYKVSDSLNYRPDDVITSVTGETIEVVHSDAEGRMILADVLAIASRKVIKPYFYYNPIKEQETPRLLIDFTTLTGTCITALTNRYIGAFTNRKYLIPQILQCSEETGERIWPLPFPEEDFLDDLKSDIADIIQCRQPIEGDHIYATSFLSKFMNPSCPWIHLDLASSYR